MASGNELRPSIVHALQTQVVKQDRLAQMLGVQRRSVQRIWQRGRRTGSTQWLPFAGGKRPKLTEGQREAIGQYVLADTDATLRELQRGLERTHAVGGSLSALSRLSTALDVSGPKRRARLPNAIP